MAVVKGRSRTQFGGQRNRPCHTGAIKGPPKGCYTRPGRLILHYWAVVLYSEVRLCRNNAAPREFIVKDNH